MRRRRRPRPGAASERGAQILLAARARERGRTAPRGCGRSPLEGARCLHWPSCAVVGRGCMRGLSWRGGGGGRSGRQVCSHAAVRELHMQRGGSEGREGKLQLATPWRRAYRAGCVTAWVAGLCGNAVRLHGSALFTGNFHRQRVHSCTLGPSRFTACREVTGQHGHVEELSEACTCSPHPCTRPLTWWS